MSCIRLNTIFLVLGILLLASCSTVEKASMHGFLSGFYSLDSSRKSAKVYVDVVEDQLDVYQTDGAGKVANRLISVPLYASDSARHAPMIFRKTSLDIDIASIFLKYRPSVKGVPAQLSADLNVALYAGLRRDRFKVSYKTDPLGKQTRELNSLGYDLGFFAGTGITPVSPFTTLNRTTNDYSGMIIQMGFAGFLESRFASFGLAIGIDHLVSRDSKIWIYNHKPWVGFVVGIALN
jgi:hypothetical protein